MNRTLILNNCKNNLNKSLNSKRRRERMIAEEFLKTYGKHYTIKIINNRKYVCGFWIPINVDFRKKYNLENFLCLLF